MESPLNHLFHAFIITILLYVLMKFVLKQSQNMALNRSILIGAAALIYMILFGHGMPTHVNKI
jgi:putative effector of murein hydrolase